MDNAERKLKLACAVIDFNVGSLWQVREDLWKETLVKYDQSSTRMWHPGLSLLAQPPLHLYDRVPMLHGCSGLHGPVVVRGITEEKGPDYPASFGSLLASVPLCEWTDEVPGADRNQVTGHGFDRKRVLLNWHKPRLTEAERARLTEWMNRRGLL